jgi:hypothetical protein
MNRVTFFKEPYISQDNRLFDSPAAFRLIPRELGEAAAGHQPLTNH